MSEGQQSGLREWREKDDIRQKTNREQENTERENESGLRLTEQAESTSGLVFVCLLMKAF